MKPPDSRLREALRFLLLSSDERVARALATVGAAEPPAFIDDTVLNELHFRGFTAYRALPRGLESEPGDLIARRIGDDRIHVGDITSLGKLWLETEPN